MIRRIKPHLILLIEVDPKMWQAIASKLPSHGLPYEATPVPPQNLTVIQYISILHRPSVVVSNVQLIDGSDLAEEERSRKAVSILVTMRKFDFVLLEVHLKSPAKTQIESKRSLLMGKAGHSSGKLRPESSEERRSW